MFYWVRKPFEWVVRLRLWWRRRNPAEVFDDLTTRRDELYQHIASMEDAESLLLKKGKSSTNHIEKRRLANQIALLRKDLQRMSVQLRVINRQIEILNSDQHNKALLESIVPELPDEDELTANATNAEMALEDLNDRASLADSVEIGGLSISDEEERILAEFEGSQESEHLPSQSEPVTPEVKSPALSASDLERLCLDE